MIFVVWRKIRQSERGGGHQAIRCPVKNLANRLQNGPARESSATKTKICRQAAESLINLGKTICLLSDSPCNRYRNFMHIITTTKELQSVCDRLATDTFVTVDTEFMRETTYWPLLCLIQLAGENEEVIVDPLSEDLSLEPFMQLMTNTSVMKVFHAARQDVEIIHHLGGVVPEPMFDTQVAAMVCGFGDSIGYENIVRQMAGQSIDKSSRFTDWSRRPLSDKQLAYALSDVTHLRPVYEQAERIP